MRECDWNRKGRISGNNRSWFQRDESVVSGCEEFAIIELLSRILDLDSLGGNPDDDVVGLDIRGYYGSSPDHGIFPDLNPRQDGCVKGDPAACIDARQPSIDFADVVDIVAVGINVRIIRNGNPITNIDPTPVIEQNMSMNYDVITERKIVPKRPLD